MARRRLEEALTAGVSIGEGKDFPAKFSSVSIDHDIKLEQECDGIFSLQYAFDAKHLAIGCGNGTIRLYETSTGKKLPDVRKSRYGGYPIMVLRFHPKNHSLLYAGTSEGQILSCDLSDFVKDGPHDKQSVESCKDERWTEIIRETKGGMKNEINCMDFNCDYMHYATAGKDLSVRLYDAGTNKEIHEFTGYDNTKDPTDWQTSGNAMRVFALRFHPIYDHIFVTGGWDRQLKIWDSRAQSNPVKRTIHGPHICGDALDLKEFKILTGSYEGRKDALQIWSYSEEKNKSEIDIDFPSNGKGAFLYAAQFCDNDVVLAGGSGTNSAKAINYKTNEVLGEVKFSHPVQALDSIAGGRLFAVGDGGHGGRSLKMCSLR